MDLNQLIKLKQYSLKDAEKNEILLKLVKEGLLHAKNNEYIKSFFEKERIDIDDINCLEDVPFLPVQMFKFFDLATCPREDIVRTLKSSGTTSGVPSRIPLNKNTMANQTKALNSILADYLGQKRKIFIVIDHQGINDPAKEISARTAGVRGLSLYAKKIFYFLKEENGKLVLNMPAIMEAAENFKGQEAYVFGFTYIIWSVFYKQLKESGLDIKFDFSNIKIFHSGGWKKMEEEKVSENIFSEKMAQLFGGLENDVHDFYGMAEQTGIIFVDCEHRNKHVPNFSQIIIRDIETQNPCKTGETGLIEVMSVLSDSYYCQAILTEDKGYVAGFDDCPCGRKGRYFKFKTRVEKAEIRGCGNTFKV